MLEGIIGKVLSILGSGLILAGSMEFPLPTIGGHSYDILKKL